MRKGFAVISIAVMGIGILYLGVHSEQKVLSVYAAENLESQSDMLKTDEESSLEFEIKEKIPAKDLIINTESKEKVTAVFSDGTEEKSYNKAGTYTEVIVLTDAQGNKTEQEVTFEVLADTVKPVMKGKGLKNRTVYVGTKKIDYLKNVTATDNVDGNLTSKIKVNKSKVNLKKAGTYTVTYSVTDSSGNTATVKKKVTVKKDAKPVLKGVKNRTVYVGSKVDYLKGVTATDKRDGNLTSKIKVNKSKVNLKKAGTYTVTYTVMDRSKNKTVKTAKIIVKNREKEYDPEKEPQGKVVLKTPGQKVGEDVEDTTNPGGKQGVGIW